MSNFDNQVKNVQLHVPIAATNTTDGMIKAAKAGAAYVQAPCDLNIDTIFLSFAMSAGVNSDGSGNFSVGVYANNVALHSTAIAVAYSAASTYTTLDRASLTTKKVSAGDVLRIDVVEVPGGAATSYPMNALVVIQGQSI